LTDTVKIEAAPVDEMGTHLDPDAGSFPIEVRTRLELTLGRPDLSALTRRALPVERQALHDLLKDPEIRAELSGELEALALRRAPMMRSSDAGRATAVRRL